MNPTAASALAAFATALALTPLAMIVARRIGVTDEPGERKRQRKAVPLLGGAAIMAGCLAGFAAGGLIARAQWRFAVILGAAGAVFLVGLLDDALPRLRRERAAGKPGPAPGRTARPSSPKSESPAGAPVWLRLLVETAAAAAVVASGVQATFLVGHPWVTVPVTIIWIVGMTNAFNFLDNMDGLSAGVAAIAAGMFVLVCVRGSQPAAPALAAVGAAALGFLPYNFRPARIYMGDAGALLIGFLLGTLSVSMTFYEYGETPLPLAAPVLVLAIPLFDMATVLWIRLRAGRPLTKGDRSHFSHRLVSLGMSERTAVVTIYLAAASIGLGATLLAHLSWTGGVVLLAQAAGVFAIVVLMERAGRNGAPR